MYNYIKIPYNCVKWKVILTEKDSGGLYMNKKFKQKLQYWFNNQMDKGPVRMIFLLAVPSVVILVLVILLINLLEPNENGILYTTWDSFSTIINAWMPSSGDGGAGYLIPTAIAALFGLLVTSILIGIITTAIEDKVTTIKKGNSIVFEENHTIILGFEPGAYELISQLIEAAGNNPFCLLVAGDVEKDSAENEIRSNVDIPGNVKLIYRTVDICDASSLKCCSVETASTIIISSYDNSKSFKSILAVVKLLRDFPNAKVNIVSSVSKDEFSLPASMKQKKHICVIPTDDVIARIIAHSCSQPGISHTFLEVLSFDGSEIYADCFDELSGLSFGQLYQRLSNAVPLGIIRDGQTMMNPRQNVIFNSSDKLLYLAEQRRKITLSDSPSETIVKSERPHIIRNTKSIVIWGYNEKINTLINELPDCVKHITAVDVPDSIRDSYLNVVGQRKDCSISFVDSANTKTSDITKDIDHVILLSDNENDRESSDIRNMMLYLNLRDIQITCSGNFNITTELFYESNKDLITSRKTTDFVVANNMTSLLVAQVAITPELIDVYTELLSNEGVEIRVITPNEEELSCSTIGELRKKAYSYGAILIGYITRNNEELNTHLNPDLDEKINLSKDDYIIGIC